MSTQTPSFKSIALAILGLLLILFSTGITAMFFIDGGESIQSVVYWLCLISFTFWFGFLLLGMRRFPLHYSINTTIVLIVTIFVLAKRVVDDNALQSKVVVSEISLMSKSLAERFDHPEKLKQLTENELKPIATGHRGKLEGFMKNVLAEAYHLQLNQYLASHELYDQLMVADNLGTEQGFQQARADLAQLTSLTEETKAQMSNLPSNAMTKLSLLHVPPATSRQLTYSFFQGLQLRLQLLVENMERQLKVYNAIAAMHRELAKYRKDWSVVNGQIRFKTELAYRDFYTAQLEHMQAVEELQHFQQSVNQQDKRGR